MSTRLEFSPLMNETPGVIVSLLRRSYVDLLTNESALWKGEESRWEQYDREAFQQPQTVGASLFVSRLDGVLAGFASWDPRQQPHCGVVGHNCILPEFRGRGLGAEQIREVLRRFQRRGIPMALATTCDHPFFLPAQRMYLACGFREVRRIPWDRDSRYAQIEYEKESG